MVSNASWAAEQLEIYYQNRTGKHHFGKCEEIATIADHQGAGPMTIP